MKLIIARSRLQEVLRQAARIQGRPGLASSARPFSDHVYFQADTAQGVQVGLINAPMWGQWELGSTQGNQLSVERPGVASAPIQKLQALVRQWEEDYLALEAVPDEQTQGGLSLWVYGAYDAQPSDSTRRYRLRGHAEAAHQHDQFDREWDQRIRVEAQVLHRLLAQTLFAVASAQESSNIALSGVCLEIYPSGEEAAQSQDLALYANATNAKILAQSRQDPAARVMESAASVDGQRLVLPADFARTLYDYTKGMESRITGERVPDPPLEMAFSATRVQVHAPGNWTLSTHLIGSAYPDVQKVFPQTYHRLLVDRKALLGALRRVTLVHDQKSQASIGLSFLDGQKANAAADDASWGAAKQGFRVPQEAHPGPYVLGVEGFGRDAHSSIEQNAREQIDLEGASVRQPIELSDVDRESPVGLFLNAGYLKSVLEHLETEYVGIEWDPRQTKESTPILLRPTDSSTGGGSCYLIVPFRL